jgi:aromatase
MAELRIRTARHTVRVAAPPKRVFQLITDAHRWPQIFDLVVSTEHLSFSGGTETVRLWELIDGQVQSYVSHREASPHRLQLRFRHDEAPEPITSMGGVWLVLPKGNGSLVALDHYYRVAGDDATATECVGMAVEQSSVAMLTALREVAELDGDLDRLWVSGTDSVDIDGDAGDVYEFLARAHDWPQRLPHVHRLTVDEEVFDIQHLEAQIRLPNGSLHATSTVRVCFPETHIVYKMTRPPAIMRAHTGTFTVAAHGGGVRATAHNTVLLHRERFTELLGEQSTVEDARSAVREVLRTISLSTLGRARRFAEARRPTWIEGAA